MKATQQQEKEFIALVEEYKQVIYKVCYVYATDADHLNDLYQEVVINLWKAYPRFRGDCLSYRPEYLYFLFPPFETKT